MLSRPPKNAKIIPLDDEDEVEDQGFCLGKNSQTISNVHKSIIDQYRCVSSDESCNETTILSDDGKETEENEILIENTNNDENKKKEESTKPILKRKRDDCDEVTSKNPRALADMIYKEDLTLVKST